MYSKKASVLQDRPICSLASFLSFRRVKISHMERKITSFLAKPVIFPLVVHLADLTSSIYLFTRLSDTVLYSRCTRRDK